MNVYRLIIVDDEPAPREGLAAFFQNQPCGFEVIGLADGGLQALAMVKEYQPDLLLADIRMPDMDGLELAKRCLELQHPPKLLIMSSYDEAAYIKTALKLQAVDYLFKPLDLVELKGVLAHIYHQLEKERYEQEQRKIQLEKLNHSRGWLRTLFLQKIVDNFYLGEDEIEKKLTGLEMDLPMDAAYCVVCVKIDRNDGKCEEQSDQKEDDLCSLMEDILSLHSAGYVFPYTNNYFVIIMKDVPEEQQGLVAEAKAVSREVTEALFAEGIHTAVGIGSAVCSRKEIPVCFRTARDNIQERVFEAKSSSVNRAHLLQAAKEIKDRLLSTDNAALDTAVNYYFQILSKSKDISLLYAVQSVSLLVSETSQVLPDMGKNSAGEQDVQMDAYERLTHCDTLPQMKEVILDYCKAVNKFVCGHVHSMSEDTVNRIRQIVGEQYMYSLNIQTIAEQVYLTPNYICLLFKQMTGQTINQYITEVRINMAKKYLEDAGVRLADVGALVGYTEPSYFSKVFKRYVALTPKEYRQMYLSLKERKVTGV